MVYFVYVLRSKANGGKFYAGLTENVERRLNEHNSGRSKFTSAYIPWKVVHIESFSTRTEARTREKYFKIGAGRKFIKKLMLGYGK